MSASESPFFWKKRIAPTKQAYLQKYATGIVLDIGSGAGLYSLFLEAQGHQVYSIDRSPITNHELALPQHLSTADAIALPFPDKAFDTVLMFDVLEHIEVEQIVLQELARVARKRIILSVPGDSDAFLPTYGLALLHHIDKTHVREYSPENIRQRLTSYGFTVIDITPHIATHMPLVVLEFFSPNLIGTVLRLATAVWLKLLMRLGMIANPIASDYLCVADLTPTATSQSNEDSLN